jgi:hypothetical protein
MRALLFVVIGLAAACGDGGGGACQPLSGACTQVSGLVCTEYGGLPAEGVSAIMSSCTEPDPDGANTWSTNGCSHANAGGACKKVQNGLCVAVWLYGAAGANTAQAKQACAAQGGTWVNP